MSGKELAGYRLLVALEAARTGNWYDAGMERELSFECADRQGVTRPDPHSLYVPDAVWSRDLTVGSSTGGGYLVGTEVAGLIEVLHNRGLLMSGLLGATMMTGLKQNETLAGQAATVTTAWQSTEASSASETATLSLSSLALSPKTISANIELTRLLRLMSAGLAERLVMRDISAGFAIAVDTAAINGSGASGEPFGLLQSPGLGTFSGTTLAYATLLGAERAVLAANGLGQAGEMAWATTPAVAEVLANRQAFSSTQTMWAGKLSAGQLIGCPAFTSMTIPTGRLIGGDWTQMPIAQWGALELRVNPYSNFQAAITSVAGFLSVDVCTMKPSAFTVSSNAVS
jgi:HK97 family phage major capsid protein